MKWDYDEETGLLKSATLDLFMEPTEEDRTEDQIKNANLLHKVKRVVINRRYSDPANDIPPHLLMKKSSFYSILNLGTFGDEISRRAVDYVTGQLVNDPMKLLSRIVKRFAMDEGEDIIKELEVVKACMKYGFDQGILNRIPCIAHNISHGLEEELDASEHTDSEVQ